MANPSANSNRRGFLAGTACLAARHHPGQYRCDRRPRLDRSDCGLCHYQRLGHQSPRGSAGLFLPIRGLGLFSYKDRPGPRMDTIGIIEATQKTGGTVAQLYGGMLGKADGPSCRASADRAADLLGPYTVATHYKDFTIRGGHAIHNHPETFITRSARGIHWPYHGERVP